MLPTGSSRAAHALRAAVWRVRSCECTGKPPAGTPAQPASPFQWRVEGRMAQAPATWREPRRGLCTRPPAFGASLLPFPSLLLTRLLWHELSSPGQWPLSRQLSLGRGLRTPLPAGGHTASETLSHPQHCRDACPSGSSPPSPPPDQGSFSLVSRGQNLVPSFIPLSCELVFPTGTGQPRVMAPRSGLWCSLGEHSQGSCLVAEPRASGQVAAQVCRQACPTSLTPGRGDRLWQ